MAKSTLQLLKTIEILEQNLCYQNVSPKCEPQLGRRGLYRQMGGTQSSKFEAAMLWVLNFSDGGHSLLEIAERSGLEFQTLDEAARMLMNSGLLKKINSP